MKLIKNKFKYPDLQRVENELGRFYLDSKGQEVPSVTNVLSSTSDQSGINEWKRRVGHEEAERILQESSSIGSNVHNALENYLQDKEWELVDDGSYISKTSILILDCFINNLVKAAPIPSLAPVIIAVFCFILEFFKLFTQRIN